MTNDRVIPKSDINYNDIRKTYSVYVCMSENTEHVPILILYIVYYINQCRTCIKERKYGNYFIKYIHYYKTNNINK